MKIKNENIILTLIIISYVVRLAIAPFHIMVPHTPHDVYAYIGPGKCMVEGKFSTKDCLSWQKYSGQPTVYGPVLSPIFAIAYMAFGQYDFFMFKAISIAFDAANTVLIYLLTKKLLNQKLAVYASFIYCLSFMPLFNSAVLGNDEMIIIFALLLGTYFLFTKRLFLSATSYAILVLLKSFPIVIAPALLLYVYKKYGLKTGFKFSIFGAVFLFIAFSIFIALGGIEKTTFYLNSGYVGPDEGYNTNLSIFSIFRYVTNINLSFLTIPALFISLFLTLLLTLKFPMKNLEIEFMRNTTLFMVATLFASNLLSGIYTIYFFPFFLILVTTKIKSSTVRFGGNHLLGFFAIFIGLLVYSIIYREGLVTYSATDRAMLLVALLAVTAGEFYLLQNFEMKMRVVWVMVVFSSLMYVEVYAAPLMVFPLKYFTQFIDIGRFSVVNKMYGDHIGGRPDLFLAYGIFYALPAVILYICLIAIYVKMLRISSE